MVDERREHREAGRDRREDRSRRDRRIGRVDDGRPVEESAGT